jgi:hypothetical protein
MAENEQSASAVEPEEARMVSLRIEIDPPSAYTYSNVAGVSISPWDIRINFADVNPVEGQTNVKAVVGVTVPPEHAAGLAILLIDQLKRYEAQFGQIRHPKWQAMRSMAKQQGDPIKAEQQKQSGQRPKE